MFRFRMVVIETKSQILEMSAHEMAYNQFQNSLNQSTKANQPFACTQAFEDNAQITAYINEGYMKLKPLLYPCTIEFSLMCLTVRESVSNIIISRFMHLVIFSNLGKYWQNIYIQNFG